MQRRGLNQSNRRESSGGGVNGNGDQIGGPFEAAPWYIHDGAQTVDLYSSIGYKSQLESSGVWNRSISKKSPKRTPKSPPEDLEYTPKSISDLTGDGEDEPPRPLEYHREISGVDKMSVSDERFEPPVSESQSQMIGHPQCVSYQRK